MCFAQVYFDDGDSVDLSDDEEEVRRQMDRLEDGGFDKYKAYLDGAQLNLEVGLRSVNNSLFVDVARFFAPLLLCR